MKIGIFGRAVKEDHADEVISIIKKIDDSNFDLFIYEPFLKIITKNHLLNLKNKVVTFNTCHEIKNNIDFLFSLGGDGTLLNTINLVRDSSIPIMGINFGRLGFLTSTTYESFDNSFESLKNKSFLLDKRSLLKIETQNNLFGDENYALNEITLLKKDSSVMINIKAYLNDEFLNSYWADGLIVSTPTGSTAYSLSCGGPIVFPESNNLIVTPIAPHNLNVRPIVISDDKILKLKVGESNQNFLVSLDSRTEIIDSSVELIISKADFNINLVKLKNQNFNSTLRSKLMWGLDNRN